MPIKILKKIAQLMRYPGIHVWPRDDVTNRETTGEGAYLRK